MTIVNRLHNIVPTDGGGWTGEFAYPANSTDENDTTASSFQATSEDVTSIAYWNIGNTYTIKELRFKAKLYKASASGNWSLDYYDGTWHIIDSGSFTMGTGYIFDKDQVYTLNVPCSQFRFILTGTTIFGILWLTTYEIQANEDYVPPPCTSTLKYSGDAVTLQATPKDGIGPYHVEFLKNGVLINQLRLDGPNPIDPATENVQITRNYNLDDADIAGASLGKIIFSVFISDSCPTGAKTCTGTCDVYIGCIAPVCNFTVS